jgi:hypothetical protein
MVRVDEWGNERPQMLRTTAAAVLAIVVFVELPATAQVVHFLDLKVINGANQARTNEPVSFGFPIAKVNNVFTCAYFQVLDASDHAVPAQYKVLSRWGGDRSDATKPFRWVLVSFPATVPALGTATYRLGLGAPSVHGDLYAADHMNDIEVHTGPTTFFRIYKWQFRLFDTAVVNGTAVAGPGHLDMVLANGSSVTPVITDTALEEYAGWQSERCVVRQRGQLGQLRFTCRWYFYSGRSDVEVDFRLENPNPYGLFSTTIPDGQVYFDSLYLVQPVLSGSSYTLTTDAIARSISPTQSYDLQQHFDKAAMTNSMDLWTGFSFTETLGGAQVGAGSRFKGAIDLTGTTAGLTVTLDRFWQSFPKSMRVQGGAIQVGLFPEWGNGPEYKGQYDGPTSTTPTDPMALTNYRFEGGRWKSARMMFNFHAGAVAPTPAAVGLEEDRVSAPLIGSATPDWIRHSGATAGLWIERRPSTDPGTTRWEKFTDMLGNDAAADVTPQGQIGYPAFIRRGSTYGGQQTYGWENFGDMPWADGYCQGHYDWPACFLDGFWRTLDYRLYDCGRDSAAARRDYNQNHAMGGTEWWRGAQFYEKGWWHGNYLEGEPGHNWLEGVLIHYTMTGDEGSREAAIENTTFIFNNSPKNWSGWWGSRIPGWSIDNLMAAYAYLGSPAYLNEAGLGVLRYQTFEQSTGGYGCVLNPANGQTTAWMENIFHIGACKYYLASGDPAVLPLLDRMRNWFKTQICVYPTGSFPNLTLARVVEHWAPGVPGNIVIHHDWVMSQSLAYSAVIFNSQEDLAISTGFHDCIARYWQQSASATLQTVTDPNGWSPVTFRPTMYPGTESKVLSNVVRWGNGQLAARMIMLGY